VIERYQRDCTRAVAPLTQAPDAIVLDSSALEVSDVVGQIVDSVRAAERLLAGRA
jgi:cytidylate kinase